MEIRRHDDDDNVDDEDNYITITNGMREGRIYTEKSA